MANIILYDRSGNANTYSGADSLEVDTTEEGVTVVFSEGEKATKTVELDMSGGEQIVEPDTGTLLSKVTILKPVTHVSENIRKNVNIGGVWGTYIGGDMLVSAHGTYTPTEEGTQIIEHNMMIPPDYIHVWTQAFKTGCIARANGFSDKILEKCNVYNARAVQTCSGETMPLFAMAGGIGNADDYDYGFIANADPKQFEIGGTLFKHSVGSTYNWEAIAGIIAHTDYFYIQLEFDSQGNLLIFGGVPEIEQFNIYANGSLVKTVDYVHGDEFVVELSDITTGYEPLTVTVKAVGEKLAELYPEQYYDTVSNGIVAGGTCGDSVYWALTAEGTLTISGIGAMADYSGASGQPWYGHASAIKTVIIEEGITAIGNQSLRQLTSLASVTIADTVTKIGVSAFLGCTSLKHIELPDSIDTIGNYAFNESGLESITIPNKVTSIYYCFYACKALKSVVLPDGLTSIGNYTFHTCSALTSIVIPASVASIGYQAFVNCTALTSATFKDTSGWYVSTSSTATSGTNLTVTNTSTAATYLRSTYRNYYWFDKT